MRFPKGNIAKFIVVGIPNKPRKSFKILLSILLISLGLFIAPTQGFRQATGSIPNIPGLIEEIGSPEYTAEIEALAYSSVSFEAVTNDFDSWSEMYGIGTLDLTYYTSPFHGSFEEEDSPSSKKAPSKYPHA